MTTMVITPPQWQSRRKISEELNLAKREMCMEWTSCKHNMHGMNLMQMKIRLPKMMNWKIELHGMDIVRTQKKWYELDILPMKCLLWAKWKWHYGQNTIFHNGKRILGFEESSSNYLFIFYYYYYFKITKPPLHF